MMQRFSSPNFKIATYKDSLLSQTFEHSDKESWKRLGNFMKPYNFHTFPENNMKENRFNAAIVTRYFLETNWKLNLLCNTQVTDSIVKDSLVFALRGLQKIT